MTERERFLAAFEGKATDRPPASDVASEILGREAYMGSVMLHYQEAAAAVKGPEAYREFRERMERDVVDLVRTLGFGAVAGPWTMGPPTRQVGEYGTGTQRGMGRVRAGEGCGEEAYGESISPGKVDIGVQATRFCPRPRWRTCWPCTKLPG